MECWAGVSSNVSCLTFPLFSMLILIVAMVLAIFKTESTLLFILAIFMIRSSSLYTLYAMKHMQICASILFSVK